MAPCLLLIESATNQGAMVLRALDHIGCAPRTRVCNDATEALDALESTLRHGELRHRGLVLLDAVSPRRELFRVLRQVRANPDMAALPVVVLGASNLIEDAEHACDLGATAYCIRPATFTEFAHVIAAIVARWNTRPAADGKCPDRAIIERYFIGPRAAPGW